LGPHFASSVKASLHPETRVKAYPVSPRVPTGRSYSAWADV
jgi:hypothetical protein